MPEAFDHVLLTRFSAVHGDADPASRDWLDYRLGFFYDACYASVTRQRDADFDWLVMFDDRCDDDFREQVEELADGAFTPLWTHAPFRRDSFARPVAEVTARPTPRPFLVTTRVDSDDAMAVDYMASVQREFAHQERLFVDFPRGVQIDRAGAVYRSDTLSNPFISLIEQRTEALPDTVYVAKHARARAHGPIREVRSPVMWAQVVHGVNLSNIVNGTRVSPSVVRERFDIDLTYDDDAAGTGLLVARGRQVARLARLWSLHPGELTKWAEARAWTLRGTHEREQDDGSTFTDRVQAAEHSVRSGWRDSSTRGRLHRAHDAFSSFRWHARGRLNRLGSGTPTLVAGDLETVLAADRVVVLAEYARSPVVRADTGRMAQAYAAAGLGVLVVAARDPWRPLRVDGSLPKQVAVVRRANVAYDFGSWSAVLAAWPEIAAKDLVILTNDSVIGPFHPLDELLARMDASTTDVWAATETLWPRPYLQSYLLAFRGGVLGREPLRGFFADVRPQESKRAVVLTYEHGLTHLIDDSDLRRQVGWPIEDLGIHRDSNTAYDGWRELFDAGYPFVKRSLLEVRHFEHHRDYVLDYLAKRFDWAPAR